MMRQGFLFLCLFFSLYAEEPPQKAPSDFDEKAPPTTNFELSPKAPDVQEIKTVEQEIKEGEEKAFWDYHHFVSLGYRRDRQKFQESASKTTISGRNSIQLNLNSHLEWKRAVVYFRGCFGWLVNGSMGSFFAGSNYGEPLSFHSQSLGAGYSVDTRMSLGVKLPFIKRNNFSVNIIPSGGYGYLHLMNFAKGQNRFTIPNPPVLLSSGTNGFAIAHFPSPNQQDWFGPYLEARVEFFCYQNCKWSLFYQYHWSVVRSNFQEDVDLYLFNSSHTATAVELFQTNGHYRSSYMGQHLAGTDFRYILASGWNFGLHFEGFKIASSDARYVARTKKEQYILAPTGTSTSKQQSKAQVKWISYEADISFGYQF